MRKMEKKESSFLKLLKYCKKYTVHIVIALIGSVIGTLLTLLGPDKLSEMTDLMTNGLMGELDLKGITSIGITLVMIYAVSFILSLTQGLIMTQVIQRVSKQLRTSLTVKINRLPMSYYNQATTGDILSRVTNDVDTLGQSLNQSLTTLVSATCLFIGSIVMMLKTNVVLTLTAILATIIGFIMMMLIMKRSQVFFLRQQEGLGKLNGYIEEAYSGQMIIKAYNSEEQMISTFQTINEELTSNTYRAQILAGFMMPLMTFIGNLGYVAVCIVGALLTMNGTISFGVIVAFIMYVRYFTQPLAQMAQAAQSLQSASAAGYRVFEFLEAEEMEDESKKVGYLKEVTGKVEFDHVSFAYEGSDRPVIKDFSMTAHPGQKVAIVGPTGAGKTTLVNLLMRFNEINRGDIRIDDVSIHDLTRENIHDLFCMVLQDTWLFEGTIKENLIYNQTHLTDEDVEQACEAVGLHHFIQTLPEGYETLLNDQLNLSAGQKQQLTIARAMLKNAPMLILDEATSSVDTRTELIIQQAMDQLMHGRTSFIIAHRLSTIKNADVILVLKDGDILESGNHEQLLAKDGFYAELYNSQFEQG
ncbi:MAG: ABC transporter ATP-binding protein [Turicibacter sp.]|jgi:ABC-type multidrug transport system fused ATPase/permease subunit|nr:ABC transporter ATP-binding protein [Turicibacter sp.]